MRCFVFGNRLTTHADIIFIYGNSLNLVSLGSHHDLVPFNGNTTEAGTLCYFQLSCATDDLDHVSFFGLVQ